MGASLLTWQSHPRGADSSYWFSVFNTLSNMAKPDEQDHFNKLFSLNNNTKEEAILLVV
jgi:hypothetical protein